MLAELEGLSEVFNFAGEESGSCSSPVGRPERALPNDTDTSDAPFTREDVESVLGYSEGENDETDWLICGKLKDGRYFFIAAGCDYTGWG